MFNSLEELKAAVEDRRQSILTLEVDLGTQYSVEHEDAKTALAQAKAMQSITGGGFLGSNLSELEQRVADTKPEPNSIWIQYRKLDLGEWAVIMKQVGGSPLDQYERVLPKTFVALYGQDPVKPEDWDEEDGEWVAPEPLSTDARLASSKGNDGVLPGGALSSVVQSFMAWQNSGGDVTIRPTKSGRV